MPPRPESSSRDVGSWEVPCAPVPEKSVEVFFREALRSSERARCSTGAVVVDFRGGGVGAHVDPKGAKKLDGILAPKSLLPLAAAGAVEDLWGRSERPPSVAEDSAAAGGSAKDLRSHCTAASRCHGNLSSNKRTRLAYVLQDTSRK